MRARASFVVAAVTLALLVPGSGQAGTPPPGWTHPKLVHNFAQFDGDGWDLVTFNQRAYAALGVPEDGVRRLYFKTNDTATGTFRSERVAEFPGDTIVKTVSIGVAPNGNVYIAYGLDPSVGPRSVFVATNASGSWVSTPVPATGDQGAISEPAFPDLAIQGDGTVAVVFQADRQACQGSLGFGDILLTRFANGTFTTPTNLTLNNSDGTRCVFNTFPALAASGNTLHLAYRWVSGTGPGVQLHYRTGSLLNATDETVDATAASIEGYEINEFGIDIVADAAGVPHIGYTTMNDVAASSLSMRYATKPGGTWTLEEVRQATSRVRGPSVAIAVDQAAVAYGVGGDVFVATRGTAGAPWVNHDLNASTSQNFDPQIAAAAGRFHALFLEVNGPLGAEPASYVYNHEAPKPVIDFNLTGGKLFRGGQAVPMKGDINPATVREKVVINTQQFRRGKWTDFDKKTTTSTATGAWELRHAALPTGFDYRARAEVGDTVDHRAGKNPWVKFEVAGRRNH